MCIDFGVIRHDLLYVKKLSNMLSKPTDVGMSNLFLIVKSKYSEWSVKRCFNRTLLPAENEIKLNILF